MREDGRGKSRPVFYKFYVLVAILTPTTHPYSNGASHNLLTCRSSEAVTHISVLPPFLTCIALAFSHPLLLGLLLRRFAAH